MLYSISRSLCAVGIAAAFSVLPLAAPSSFAQQQLPAAEQTEQPSTPATEVPAVSLEPTAEITPSGVSAVDDTSADPQNGIVADEAAEVEAVSTPASVPNSTLPHELSVVGMFLAADIVVKAVMTMLAVASLATWTIWLAKSLQIMGARARANRGLRVLSDARTLAAAADAMGKRRGVVAAMLATAGEELRFSDGAIDHAGDHGVKERVALVLSRIEARAGRHMSKGTGVLATIGSTAPFVGLFGTVWGIMNAFIGISESQTTNLAVVAPGIAEALLATAVGLIAAIPAVIIYNVFARSVTGYRQLLADAGASIERLVSRDLDFRRVPASPAASLVKSR